MAKGGLQINQLSFNMLGKDYVSQSYNFPDSQTGVPPDPEGQKNLIYDNEGNLILENSGAPRPIIKSFFKGPITTHANDNGKYGEAYFEVSYEDFNYAKLEYTVTRKYFNNNFYWKAWFITEIYYWSLNLSGTPILQIYESPEAFNSEDLFGSYNYGTNNVTNFGVIYNTPSNDSLTPHFDQFNKTIKFCRPFGSVNWSTDPPTFDNEVQIPFETTPCYVKGIATLL